MQAYYNLIDTLTTALLEDENVNTCTNGGIDEVDLKKQTIFPLSHFIINGFNYENGIYTFRVSVLCMDIVSDDKSGGSNEEDALNSQLAVITKLMERLSGGDLYQSMFQLIGITSADKFVERFENNLAGWGIDLEIQTPNLTIGIC